MPDRRQPAVRKLSRRISKKGARALRRPPPEPLADAAEKGFEALEQGSPLLDAGRLCALVAALRIPVETTPEARECIHYVFWNRHGRRYPQFRAKGLCVSSGVVEAGCKQIGARLQRTGMRWTVAGATAIIVLRCCILSGRFEDCWERRSRKCCLAPPSACRTLISQRRRATSGRVRLDWPVSKVPAVAGYYLMVDVGAATLDACSGCGSI